MLKTVTNLYCDCCGELIYPDVPADMNPIADYRVGDFNYYIVENKILCSDCFDDKVEPCGICNKNFFSNSMIDSEWINNGEPICKNCFETKIFPDIKKIFDALHSTEKDAETNENEG